jgi:hypothetical protein
LDGRAQSGGKITVKGSFIDLNGGCGNGVLWFINQGNKTLASGDLLNGGNESFNLAKVKVNQGAVLYFIVDPKNGEYSCDWTRLNLTITGSGD